MSHDYIDVRHQDDGDDDDHKGIDDQPRMPCHSHEILALTTNAKNLEADYHRQIITGHSMNSFHVSIVTTCSVSCLSIEHSSCPN